MHEEKLRVLLVEGTFTPGSVTDIANLCKDWFLHEGSVVSFVFRSIFLDLISRDWDDEQGVPTSLKDRFVEDILPRLNAVLTVLPGNPAASLNDLAHAYQHFTRNS